VPDTSRDLLHELLRYCYIGVLTTIFPRAVVEDVGGFDPTLRLCEDWDLWLRIARKYALIAMPDIVADYRCEPGSMSGNRIRMVEARRRILTDDRMFHTNCRRCRDDLRFARRETNVVLSTEFCCQSRNFAKNRRFLSAAFLAIRAIALDPRAGGRLLKRVLSQSTDREATVVAGQSDS
jgi:hypothetical protein